MPPESAINTIPLFVPSSAGMDGCHDVTAPGGYESWRCEAEQAGKGLRLIATLSQGSAFSLPYLRAYQQYLARPTRRLPPSPRDYPSATLAVYEKSRLLGKFTIEAQPSQYHASCDVLDVHVGANSIRRQPNGSIQLSMFGTTLSFEPAVVSSQARPQESDYFSRELSGAIHRRVIADPLCRVTGTISIGPEMRQFEGLGCLEHRYGTAPIAASVRRLFSGTILQAGRTIAFHCMRPVKRGSLDEAQLTESDASGTRQIPGIKCWGDWGRRTPLMLRYPQVIQFVSQSAAANVVLSQPRLLEASAFRLCAMYEANVGSEAGQALCEIVCPRRLLWPVLGRIIGASGLSGVS